MITVFTGVHKRPDIFELFCKNFTELENPPEIIVGGDKNDPCEAVAAKYGIEYMYPSCNLPLGRKNNDIMEYVCERSGANDYVLYMGSDNLMSQTMWDYYTDFDGDILALLDYYFVKIGDLSAYYWGGYVGKRAGEPIGAAKLMRVGMLADVSYRPWVDGNTRSTDFDMWNSIVPVAGRIDLVKMSETGGISLDIKSPVGLTKIETIQNTKRVDYSDMVSGSPEIDNILQSWK
jgi:hypothetical protein